MKPVRQAQRKPKSHHAGVEQRIHRELRGIERTIGMSIGLAIAGSALYW